MKTEFYNLVFDFGDGIVESSKLFEPKVTASHIQKVVSYAQLYAEEITELNGGRSENVHLTSEQLYTMLIDLEFIKEVKDEFCQFVCGINTYYGREMYCGNYFTFKDEMTAVTLYVVTKLV